MKPGSGSSPCEPCADGYCTGTGTRSCTPFECAARTTTLSEIQFERKYLTNDDLGDVVELVPVVIIVVQITVQRLELGSTGNRHVECLGREEALLVEQIEVVAVVQVRHQLVAKTVQ